MTLASLVDRLLRIRFVRFGTVGASGTVINLTVPLGEQEVLTTLCHMSILLLRWLTKYAK